MTLFHTVFVIATFLCSLVAGFLFAFAVVVMPGIRNLEDAAFVRAFQVVDGIVQQNQPVFMVVWVGSVLMLVAAAVLSIWELSGASRLLLIAATVVYLLGVQAPTAIVNVPLNNAIQRVDVRTASQEALARARHDFEGRWNRSNVFRTVGASLVALLLMVLLTRL